MSRSPATWIWIILTILFALQAQPAASQSGDSRPDVSQQIVLPDTPAGKCAAAYFKAFNSGSNDKYRAYMLKYRTEEYLKETPVEKLLGTYRMIYETCESLTPVRIAHETDNEIVIISRPSRIEGFIETRFQMDSEDPPHLEVFTIKPLATDAAAEPAAIDDRLIGGTIASVAKILREQYVDREKGEKIASKLEQYYAQGKYVGITDGVVLALKVGEDLRAISQDGHLGLQYGKPPDDEEVAEVEDNTAAELNYGFRKVEILPENIGYIAFDQCHHSEKAREVAAEALEKVADCQALILDIRRNQGGSPKMVDFMASYFFDTPTLLGSRYSRVHDDEFKEFWSSAEVPGRRFGKDVPVYILTSSYTCSAAEAFTIGLQEHKRATVVGEKPAEEPIPSSRPPSTTNSGLTYRMDGPWDR